MKPAAVLVSCAVATTLGLSQRQAGDPQPRFRGGVELVQLDVTVLDRQGMPVRGLTAADFTIVEEGVVRPVASFSAVDVPDRIETGASWVRDVAPDVASNQTNAQRVVIVVLDECGTPRAPGVVKTAKQIAGGVVDRLGPSDLAAVVFTLMRRGGQELTRDRRLLMAAIDRFMPAGVQAVSESRFSASTPNGGSVPVGGPSGVCNSQNLAQALENAGKTLSAWSGTRKTLVLVGPGQGLSPDVLTESPFVMDANMKAFAALQNSNVTVYQFDPRGLEVGRHADEDIDLYSDATGGRAIHDTNTPWEMVPQMFRENSSYYLLAFAPSSRRQDGRFRRLSVKVNRPDVQVRTRAGHFDTKPDAVKSRPDSTPLDRAIEAPLPTGDLPVTLTAVPFADPAKKGGALIVVAGIDAQSSAVLDVETAAFHDTWNSAGTVKQRVELESSSAGADEPHADIGSRFDLPAGRYEIRLAVHDRGTDRIGSAQVSVSVPDYAKAPLELSGIALERATSSGATGPVADIVAAVPTTIRTFSRAEPLTALVRIYQGTERTQPIQPVRIHMRIQSAAGDFPVDHELVVDADRFEAGRAADCRLNVPLAELPAGEYLLSVEAGIGERRVTREVRLTVKP